MQKLANPPRNAILQGDCIEVLADMAPNSVDFVLTDPPYFVRYKSRDGRRIHNDDNARWLEPAFAGIYRVLKFGSYCISFYGWTQTGRFFDAWTKAGFRPVGHVVFTKRYASGGKLLRYSHESAYLLAKGNVPAPPEPIADVIEWKYTGNRLHPTQKPVSSLRPLVQAFCPQGGLLLDPFCGSGSSLVAARSLGRDYLGIEIDSEHYETARTRLNMLALPKAA